MADTVKIDASLIGIKTPIEVLTSYANVRSALVLNRDVIQSEDNADGANPVDWINANIELLDRMAKYIKETLKLTAKQADKLQDLDVNELTAFGRTVSAAILHMDSVEADTADQKSDDAQPTDI